MSNSIAEYLRQGISPQAFMDGMTKNQDAFLSWYKQFEWADEEDRSFFESLQFRDDLRCEILAADWCGDVVRNVPVVFKAMEAAGIPTEVLIMEQFPELMDQYLTMGGRSVPVVIITDTGGHVLGKWGPRPSDVQAHMIAFKQANPDREAADYQDNLKVVRQQMMETYGEGTDYHNRIVRELRELLSSF
ncbi:thioredoxin family protein [Paenibacillus sp. ACRRX]|uniref:thioredoxin family protein n=1 Tax=Paenibacillus sp. ACRRX TaxID=2918206 RepID=UPI001EF6D2F1|nr:thioredoxin family protein [Paenibacillus sp. ACRRX]MCG7409759.1 thioredoxin family protein [Paenibacillus sp. ACRRX]